MGMYHPGHPDGNYRMFNEVQVLDPPRAGGPGLNAPVARPLAGWPAFRAP
jgi:hypothetical protein